MGQLFERWNDPNYLQGDFITDSMSARNPRWVMGGIVWSICKLMGWHWTQAFLALKIATTLLIPPLMFLFVRNAMTNLGDNQIKQSLGSLLAFLAIAFILLSRQIQLLTMLGDYLQIELRANAHSVAVLIALSASATVFAGYRSIGYLIFACATFCHPTVGAILFTAHALFDPKLWNLKSLVIALGVTVLLPFVGLLLAFASSQPIPTQEFIDIYIKSRLPHHYNLLAQSRTKLTIIGLGFLTLWWYIGKALRPKFPNAALSAKALSALFVIAIFSQWFFVHVLPLKPVAIVGPMRICAFLYLLTAPLVGLALLQKLEHSIKFNSSSWAKPLPTLVPLVFVAGLSALAWSIGEKEPIQNRFEKDQSLYTWIQTSTAPDAVFATFVDDLAEELPLIGKRAVFVSQVFPFREEFYPEYKKRWNALFGPDRNLRNEYFHQRTPQDLQAAKAQGRIDYVVFKKDQAPAFQSLTPVYQDEKFQVYSIN